MTQEMTMEAANTPLDLKEGGHSAEEPRTEDRIEAYWLARAEGVAALNVLTRGDYFRRLQKTGEIPEDYSTQNAADAL